MVISEGLEGVTGATPGPGITALGGYVESPAPSETVNLLGDWALRDGEDARGRAEIPQTGTPSAARITPEQGFNPATQTPAPEQPPVISGTDDGAGAVAATSPETLRRDTPEPQAAIPMAMPMPQAADNGAAEPQAPEAATRAAQGAAARTEEARAEGAGLPQAAVNQMQQASSLLAGGEALRAAVAAALLGQSP
jgi:hypothetical protein